MSEPNYNLKQIAPNRWRLPEDTQPGMRVPGEIIASPEMLPHIIADKTPQQVANVATLPGIVGASLAMPDIHWGYGFPIGGVAAFDLDEGIISPGGVGYDINCGVCLVRSDIKAAEILPRIPELVESMFDKVPCGVGSEGHIKLSPHDYDQLLTRGAAWLVEKGLADPDDLDRMEERGGIDGGDPSVVSPRARERAQRQLGTLGSGNHFLELQEVVEIYDLPTAQAFELFPGQLVLMIHSGSRGLGHQICDESLKIMQGVVRREGIDLPDRQLACAPFRSKEGQDYLAAMNCAANFAWGNRLAMVSLARQAIGGRLKKSYQELGLRLVWDVCHNIAKVEEFDIGGRRQKLCVHRKGATRAFGPNHPGLPERYRFSGQPVLIPGDMGRASYILTGTSEASRLTFASTCHGAGRLMSRHAAIQATRGEDIVRRLAKQGVTVRARSRSTLNEEVPEAYKDVSMVVDAVSVAGISRRVARMRPLGTVKG